MTIDKDYWPNLLYALADGIADGHVRLITADYKVPDLVDVSVAGSPVKGMVASGSVELSMSFLLPAGFTTVNNHRELTTPEPLKKEEPALPKFDRSTYSPMMKKVVKLLEDART